MNMKRIVIQVMKDNIGKMVGLFLLVIFVVVVNLLPPQVLRIIIDDNLNGKSLDQFLLRAGFYLLFVVLIGVLDFIKGFLLTSLGQSVIRRTRSFMFEKTKHIPLQYYSSHAVGTLTSRFTTDTESINTLFADGIISMAIDALKIIGIFVSIAFFSIKLTLVAFLMLPVIIFITRMFQKGMKKAQNENLKQLGLVGNHITESLKNIQMIQLFHKEAYMEERYCERLTKNYETRQKVNTYDSFYAPAIQMIRAIVITVIVLLSSDKLHILGITAGMLAASIELICNLLQPIESLGMEFQNIQQGFSGIRRVDEFLALSEEEKDESLRAEDILQNNNGERMASIRFSHVNFSYEDGQPVLQDVSFEVLKRQSVTLTGRTGVGKTTMMNLVLGLLNPQDGEVYINDTPTCRIPDREKRYLFGYVEQRFQFVPGTVLDQITLGDTSITREQVEQVCRFTGLEETINSLPNGYETSITNGTEFSYGQRQLLSIARAIVCNPPILLLDEITANLDSATEERVVNVLKNACANRTILSISHRLVTMMNCDKIVHIEHGRVQKEG